MTLWKIAFSSVVIVRNGEPMSLRGPEVMALASTPTFSKRPLAFTVSMITPMLPVTVDGCTKIASAAMAIVVAFATLGLAQFGELKTLGPAIALSVALMLVAAGESTLVEKLAA